MHLGAAGSAAHHPFSLHQPVANVPPQDASGGRTPAQRPMLSASRSARAASRIEPAVRQSAHSAAATPWRYGPDAFIRAAAAIRSSLAPPCSGSSRWSTAGPVRRRAAPSGLRALLPGSRAFAGRSGLTDGCRSGQSKSLGRLASQRRLGGAASELAEPWSLGAAIGRVDAESPRSSWMIRPGDLDPLMARSGRMVEYKLRLHHYVYAKSG